MIIRFSRVIILVSIICLSTFHPLAFVSSATYYTIYLTSKASDGTWTDQGTIWVKGEGILNYGINIYKEAGQYEVITGGFGVVGDYKHGFDHWETSGSIDVSNVNNPDTIITVSGDGTLTAVVKKWDFSLDVSPNSQTVTAGDTAYHSFTVTSTSIPSYGQVSISLTPSGIPPGATYHIGPNPVTISSDQPSVDGVFYIVTTLESTPPDTYNVTLTGTLYPTLHSEMVSLTVNAPGEDKPDLTIFDVTWSPPSPGEGDEVTFLYTVKNQELEDATSFRVAIWIDLEVISNDIVPSLSAGSTEQRTFPDVWTAPSAGSHEVTVKADADNGIAESDEDNNVLTTEINVGPSTKTSTSLTIQLNPSSISENTLTTVTISGQLVRSATGTGIAGKTISLTWPGDSDTVETNGNGEYSHQVDIYYSSGTYVFSSSFEGDLDYESSSATAILEVHRPGGPDLVMLDVFWEPSDLSFGDSVTFSYSIKNQGTEGTTDFTNALYIDGERTDISARTSLATGETQTRSFTYTWTATEGSHEIKVVADDLSEISESDESNNQMSKALTLSPPERALQLQIDSVSVSNEHSIKDKFIYGANDTITVVVTDVEGEPITGARVTAKVEQYRSPFVMEEKGNGIYILSELQIGEITTRLEMYTVKITAMKEGYLSASTVKEFPSLVPSVFNIDPIKGWSIDPENPIASKTDGRLYIAFYAIEDPLRQLESGIYSQSWLILDGNGQLVTDPIVYGKTALTAGVAFMTEGTKKIEKEENLRKNVDYWRKLPTYATIAEVATAIRDFGSKLLGAIAIGCVTGGATLPTIKGVITKETIEEILTKPTAIVCESIIVGKVEDLIDLLSDRPSYRSKVISGASTQLELAATWAEKAADVLNTQKGLWDSDKAAAFYYNYKGAILNGMESMVLRTETLPPADVISQLASIIYNFAEGAIDLVILPLSELFYDVITELVKRDEALNKALGTREKFETLFEPFDVAYLANADKIRQVVSEYGDKKIANVDNYFQLAEAVEEGKIGASITVKSEIPYEGTEVETRLKEEIYRTAMQIETEVIAEKIVIEVSSDVEEGTVIVVDIDYVTLPISDLKQILALFNGKEIDLADDYADVLNPYDEDVPEYLVILGAWGVQVLVSIPQFSSHTITITKRTITPTMQVWSLFFLFLTIGVSIAIMVAYRIRKQKSKTRTIVKTS